VRSTLGYGGWAVTGASAVRREQDEVEFQVITGGSGNEIQARRREMRSGFDTKPCLTARVSKVAGCLKKLGQC
jgi:hypothetical protein